MRFGSRLTDRFYGGTATTSLVPDVFPVSLNGRPYLIDDERLVTGVPFQAFTVETVALLRNQADQSAVPSEASINPEDLWRRSTESWHHGAGQSHFDRPDSDPWRYRTSKGVDVWTRFQMSLLNDTGRRRTSSATNLALVTAGTYLYVVDGNELYWTQDITVASPTWTAATIQNGETAQSVKSVASDGKTVYAALGSNGIHTTTRGATTSSHYSDLSATLVAYVKGRLMAANGNAIYNVTSSGAAPSPLLTHPNSDFTWIGFAGGPSAIYAAGYSGDKSLVYRTAVKADGTALDVPVIAGELPDGEIVRAVDAYLGFLLLGTDKGWRLVELDGAGNFATMSDIIDTPGPVRCFEPQNRFVWYGLEDYDSASTGLGRSDLSQFTTGLNPAYASDLMAPGQGAVTSVATFQDVRVFTVSGSGVWAEDTANRVPSGTIDSGLITYGLADTKVAMLLDVSHEPLLYGGHSAFLSVDSGPFQLVGAHTVGAAEGVFSCSQRPGEAFEVRHELDRSATLTSAAPTLNRATLFSEPAPPRSYVITVPLILTTSPNVDPPQFRDPEDDLEDIRTCVRGRQLVSFQRGTKADAVLVKDFQMAYLHPDTGEGTCTVVLKIPAGT